MKTYFALITATALALSACGGETPADKPVENTSNNSATATASASNTATATASNVATASAECNVSLESNDNMQFTTREINVKSSCQNFTITLNHTGKMPKAGMGHNVVITKASDKDGVVSDGMSVGLDKDYLKPDDPRVIVATKLIGGGESDTITFPVSKLAKGQDYVFFCSFPGHAAMMSGKVNLVD